LQIQKPSVARVIVRAIRNGDPPGRFLKKDEKSGKWLDVGDKKAAEKTSQALREKIGDEQESGQSITLSQSSRRQVLVERKDVTTCIEFDADKLMATISATVAAVPASKRICSTTEQVVNNVPNPPNTVAIGTTLDAVELGSDVNSMAVAMIEGQEEVVQVAGPRGAEESDDSQVDMSIHVQDSGNGIVKSEEV
jgi:hypothetical protein